MMVGEGEAGCVMRRLGLYLPSPPLNAPGSHQGLLVAGKEKPVIMCVG